MPSTTYSSSPVSHVSKATIKSPAVENVRHVRAGQRGGINDTVDTERGDQSANLATEQGGDNPNHVENARGKEGLPLNLQRVLVKFYGNLDVFKS